MLMVAACLLAFRAAVIGHGAELVGAVALVLFASGLTIFGLRWRRTRSSR
jgi:hypothetical protein